MVRPTGSYTLSKRWRARQNTVNSRHPGPDHIVFRTPDPDRLSVLLHPIHQQCPHLRHSPQLRHGSVEDRSRSRLAHPDYFRGLLHVTAHERPHRQRVTFPGGKAAQGSVHDGPSLIPSHLVQGIGPIRRQLHGPCQGHFRCLMPLLGPQGVDTEVLAEGNGPESERTVPRELIQPLQDREPTVLEEVPGLFVVSRVRANRDPDPRAEFLNQLTQKFRVAVVKPLDIDWISDRSMPSRYGPCGLRCRLVLISSRRCARSALALKIGQKSPVYRSELEVMTTASYH